MKCFQYFESGIVYENKIAVFFAVLMTPFVLLLFHMIYMYL